MSSRHDFMLAGALAGSALVAMAEPADAASGATAGGPNFPLLLRGHYDHDGMMAVVNRVAPHRHCFLSDASLNGPPGVVNLYEKMTNASTVFELAY